MGKRGNELNFDQLCREASGDSCSISGCGSHTGTVAAALKWDGDMEIMKVNPMRENSYERMMHDRGISSFMLDLRKGRLDEEVWQALMDERRERFIGVIYRLRTQAPSHYYKAVLPRQFGCCLWFDYSRAVEASEAAQLDV